MKILKARQVCAFTNLLMMTLLSTAGYATIVSKGISPLREALTVIAYQDIGIGQQQIRTATASYTDNGKITPQLKLIVKQTTRDRFTGRELASIDAKSNTVRTNYDALGREQRINYSNKDGVQAEILTYTMDTNGSHTQVKYPDGISKTTYRNALGQTVANYDSLHHTALISTKYNDLGQAWEQIDREGIQTQKTFDAQGRVLTRAKRMLGHSVQITQHTDYNDVKNEVQTYTEGSDRQVSAKVEKYTDDSHHLVQQTFYPRQSMARNITTAPIKQFVTHNNFGEAIELNDARDNTHRQLVDNNYDAQGNVIQTFINGTEANDTPLRIDFSRDELAGKLTSKTLTTLSPDGSITSKLTRYKKQFSATGQLLQVKLLGGDTRSNALTKSFDYDALGNPTTLHDWHSSQQQSNTPTITYNYTNILGKEKITAIHVPAHKTNPQYTLVNHYSQTTGKIIDRYQLVGTTTKRSHWIHYSYDKVTYQLTEKTYGYNFPLNKEKSIHYEYDWNSGRLIAITNPLGYVTRFTYGDINDPNKLHDLLTKVIIYQPNTIAGNAGEKLAEVDYVRDSQLRLSTKSRYRFDDVGNKIAVDSYHYQYNAFGDIEGISHKMQASVGNPLENILYDLNAKGEITHETYYQSDSAHYREITSSYDNLDRLIATNKIEHQDGDIKQTQITYRLDANNNLKHKWVVTSQSGIKPCWDREQASVGFTINKLDQIKNIKIDNTGAIEAISYDSQTGDLLQDEKGDYYHYDGLHKLTELDDKNGHLLASYTQGSDGMRESKRDGKTHLYYYYNQQQLLTTLDSQGSAAFYLIGLTREARLVIKSGQTQPSIRFYGYDNHSVSNTMDFNSQGKATAIDYHHYDDYGKSLDKNMIHTELTIDYDPYSNGAFAEYSEQETQGRLQYRPSREYVASLHQFSSLDTDDRFNNRYAYAEGNPRMKFDPSGNSAVLGAILQVGMSMLGMSGKGMLQSKGIAKAAVIGGAADIFIMLSMLPNIIAAANPHNTGQADAVLALLPMAVGCAVGSGVGMLSRTLLPAESTFTRGAAGLFLGVGGSTLFSYFADKWVIQNCQNLNGMYDYTHNLDNNAKKNNTLLMAVIFSIAGSFGCGEWNDGVVEEEEDVFSRGQDNGRHGFSASRVGRRIGYTENGTPISIRYNRYERLASPGSEVMVTAPNFDDFGKS